MRGPRTLVLEDQETGLTLHTEQRRNPGGGTVHLYSFEVTPPRGLPGHLAPADPADAAAARRAFAEIVDWLKANPA